MRWARKSDVNTGDQRLATYHGRWYIIEKLDDTPYGYQIIRYVKNKDVDRVKKELEERYGRNKAEKMEGTIDEIGISRREQLENGEERYDFDAAISEHSGESDKIFGLDRYEKDRRGAQFNADESAVGSNEDRQGNGTSGLEDNNYGDISLIFGKDSIDPEADSRNMVYGSDAWTPTKPILEREVNYKVQNQFDNKIYKLSEKAFDGVFKRSSVIGSRIGTDVTKLSAEELTEKLADDTAVVAAYAEEKGIDVKPVYKEKVFDAQRESHETFEQKKDTPGGVRYSIADSVTDDNGNDINKIIDIGHVEVPSDSERRRGANIDPDIGNESVAHFGKNVNPKKEKRKSSKKFAVDTVVHGKFDIIILF